VDRKRCLATIQRTTSMTKKKKTVYLYSLETLRLKWNRRWMTFAKNKLSIIRIQSPMRILRNRYVIIFFLFSFFLFSYSNVTRPSSSSSSNTHARWVNVLRYRVLRSAKPFFKLTGRASGHSAREMYGIVRSIVTAITSLGNSRFSSV